MIGPEGGAWSEGAAGVDVLAMSSSITKPSSAPCRGTDPTGGRVEAGRGGATCVGVDLDNSLW